MARAMQVSSPSAIRGEHDENARSELLLPKPFDGPVLHFGETEDAGAGDSGGRIAL